MWISDARSLQCDKQTLAAPFGFLRTLLSNHDPTETLGPTRASDANLDMGGPGPISVVGSGRWSGRPPRGFQHEGRPRNLNSHVCAVRARAHVSLVPVARRDVEE
eukprot:2195678-Prymnesium_polylepis.1